VLQQQNEEAHITNLKLHVKPFTRWYRPYLDPFSNHKVKELELNIKAVALSTELDIDTTVVIPPAMFSSETLTSLCLAFSMSWVPESVWLPKVRYVHFTSCILKDENSVQRFLDGCPMLEIFEFVIKASEEEDETQVKLFACQVPL